jgi:hypothetical protein
VTGPVDVPRGPDVLHRVRVPGSWLDEGATIELDLPRNLSCAKCSGGGCDSCGRAGAVTLRGRREPAEIVRVTLPKRGDSAELTASERGVVIRIPERGGHSEIEGMPRGLLMLTVVASMQVEPGVVRVEPILVPAIEPEVAVRPAPVRPAARPPRNWIVIVVAVLVALWILALILLRLGGFA